MNQSQLAYHAPLRQYVLGSTPADGLLASIILGVSPQSGDRQPGNRKGRQNPLTVYDPTVEMYPTQYTLDAGSNLAFRLSNSPALQCRDGAPHPTGHRTIGRRNADDREPGEIGEEEEREETAFELEEGEETQAYSRVVFT